jgi:rhodanese-related sulfurtransferase/quercetin dioxygenase-like cupin family protein
MVTTTTKLLRKNIGTPDFVKEMPRSKIEWLDLENRSLAILTFEPGWRWSEHVRPLANTESCQCTHAQYVVSGRLKVVMDDGEMIEVGPGDFVTIPPGHDASVLGDEPFCAIDLSGLKEMRKPGLISAVDAHELLRTDPAAVLVCAYEKDEDFQHNDLEGAISLSEFRRRTDSIPRDENVIFYCACPHDETATKQAREYYKHGFVNARILDGGVDAWCTAGYAQVGAIA